MEMNFFQFLFTSCARVKSDLRQRGWECAETLRGDWLDANNLRYCVRLYRDDWHGKPIPRAYFDGDAGSMFGRRNAMRRAARKAVRAWEKYPEAVGGNR